MNILVYRWNSYNYIDIIATFQSMGHQVDVIEQELESYDEDEVFAARLHGILQQKNYDFVFTVNYFAVISGVCQQMGIKYVSWSCDSPLLSMYHKNVFLDCNYFFLFDKTNYLEFKGMGVKHIWHLPLTGWMSYLHRILWIKCSWQKQIVGMPQNIRCGILQAGFLL